MDENAEYCAIVAFTKDNDPTCEKNRQQLYALWTAYCIHHDLVVSSAVYEAIIGHLFFALLPKWAMVLLSLPRVIRLTTCRSLLSP